MNAEPIFSGACFKHSFQGVVSILLLNQQLTSHLFLCFTQRQKIEDKKNKVLICAASLFSFFLYLSLSVCHNRLYLLTFKLSLSQLCVCYLVNFTFPRRADCDSSLSTLCLLPDHLKIPTLHFAKCVDHSFVYS